MIRDSNYWKRHLWDIAQDLSNRSDQRVWRDASLAKLELGIMTGFYIIRKLIEARKVGDSVPKKEILLGYHPATGERITYRSAHRIDRLFDFSRTRHQRRQLRYVCNQIVHSYIFTPLLAESGGWAGVVFASDRDKRRGAYWLDAEDVVQIFEDVALDDPVHTRWWIDGRTGKEHMVVRSEE